MKNTNQCLRDVEKASCHYAGLTYCLFCGKCSSAMITRDVFCPNCAKKNVLSLALRESV